MGIDEVCDNRLSDWETLSIEIAAIIAAFFSILASSFILLTNIRFGTNKLVSKLIVCIAIADLGWSLSMFIEYMVNTIAIYENTTPSGTFLCTFRGLYQFFSGSSISWTSIFALYLFLVLYIDHKYATSSKIFLIFSIFGWGIPIIVDAILLYLREMETGYCFPKAPYHLMIWGNYIVIGFAFNALMFIIVGRKYSTLVRAIPSMRETTITSGLLGYIVAFLCNESFNIATIILNNLYGKVCSIFWVILGNSITLNSAGIFNCLVYATTSKTIRANYSFWSGSAHFLFAPILLLPYFIIWCVSPKTKEDRILYTVTDINRRSYQPINDA